MRFRRVVFLAVLSVMIVVMAGCVDQNRGESSGEAGEDLKLVATSPAVADICDKLELELIGVCSSTPVSYTHLDVYKRQGIPFKVTPQVLIPRQDTETMVEDAIEAIEKGTLRGRPFIKAAAIKEVLDLCTGSGAIGVSIAKMCPCLLYTSRCV